MKIREFGFHEVSNIFPMMSAEEYRELKADIEKNGLREPIWICDNQIIDGRNRYNACKELGIEPNVREWDGRGSLISFVISENLQRRHLTSEQKACVAVEALPYFEKEAKERQRLSQGRGKKGSQKIEHLNGNENKASEQAAKTFNTNRQSVADAKKIKQKAPKLFKQVRSGKMKLKDAKRELRRQEFAAKAVQFAEGETAHNLGLVEIHCADGRELSRFVKPNSAQLVITSPPYNVGIEYREHIDAMDDFAYQEMISAVFRECYQALEEGGRIAVVVPFARGRTPYVPFDCLVMDLLRGNGFTLRGRIIWDKGTSGNRTSWGSFRLPTNPVLRDTTEAVIVAHKGSDTLAIPEGVLLEDEKGRYSPFLKDDRFMFLAQDHWEIAPESAERLGHPAPFPKLLAELLIRFYGYPGCHVLDPFAGSGTVGAAAKELGCPATLVEIDAAYCELAKERINGIHLQAT